MELAGRRLLVDCGLFQGLKNLRVRNWSPFAVPPASIDAVILTHAHIDHAGYLPLLARNGFTGPVYCTAATRELCSILLPDSARLQEEDADFANRHRFSRHAPALPLYSMRDVESALQLFRDVPFDQALSLFPDVQLVLRKAGHILGAASVLLSGAGRSILFSGDLGPPDDPIVEPPDPAVTADCIVVESTYGDRLHPVSDARAQLASVVRMVARHGSVLLIPAFAVGRTQLLLHLLTQLRAEAAVPHVPVFLDSPLALSATRMLRRHSADLRLSPAELDAMEHNTYFAETVDDSRQIDARRGPMVVIAGSGMATGGRITHHLKRFGGEPRNVILLSGYQAAGTRGAALASGVRELRIHGATHPIRAQVMQMSGVSAHADQNQLITWLSSAGPPRNCFVTHGEPVAAHALRDRIERELGWSCSVPDDGASAPL